VDPPLIKETTTFKITEIPMRTIVKLLFVSTLLGTVLSCTLVSSAADTAGGPTEEKTAGKPSGTEEKGKAKRDWYPFGGIVASVDLQGHTIALKKKQGQRLLRIEEKSKLEIQGKSAALGSVKVGDYAHGKLHKDSAGSEMIISAKFDKEAPKKSEAKESSSKQK
jgi:hypothetical protein